MTTINVLPLNRPSVDQYLDAAQDIIDARALHEIPVVIAPMGSGKSTRLPIILSWLMKKNIDIVVPSVLLARDLLHSIESALQAMKSDDKYKKYVEGIQIGSSIEGQRN